VADYKFGINEPPHMRWPVAWYNPLVLLRSAKEMIASGDFIRNFDRRELFTGDFDIVDQAKDHDGEDFWWDFMSDSGDGGNASYTVARAMQSANLPVTFADGIVAEDIEASLPGAKLLVLGGDLAYPGASTEEYQYRFIEMWEAAKPNNEKSNLTVVSIPQNHDWFDNISSFSRHFVGEYTNHFLQAHTPQNRSYFATRLPHDWWILGLDFALVGDLDRMQYEAFLNLFMGPDDSSQSETLDQKPIRQGHNVILLYPEPYWTRPLGDDAGSGYPRRYQRLEAQLLHKGIKIRMRIAGDLHHYVRESACEGAQLDYKDLLVTCGAGGAFLHPTHAKRVVRTKVLDRINDPGAMTADLEKRVCVGLKKTTKLEPDQRQYTHNMSYPSRTTSRLLSCWNLLALFKPTSLFGLFADEAKGNFVQRCAQRVGELCRGLSKGNFMFPVLLGALYFLAVYCISFVFSKSFEADGFMAASEIGNGKFTCFLLLWFKALFFSPLALGVHIVLLMLCGSIAHEDGKHAFFIGVLYGIVHILATAGLFWLGSKCGLNDYYKGFVIFGGGILVGGFLFGVYFTLVALFGGLANNAFSAIAHQGYKGFLRFRIDKNGTLHGYMVGTDAVPQRWVKNPLGKYPLWSERKDQDAPEWKVRDAFSLKQ
jgi:hypothetical protein